MPTVNNEFLPYQITSDCYLIKKDADGYYDLGSAQLLSPAACQLANEDRNKFEQQYGAQYGIGQNNQDGSDSTDQKGGGLLSGGLFNWIGLGLVGKGKGNPPPPKPFEWLIILAVVVGAFFIIKNLKK